MKGKETGIPKSTIEDYLKKGEGVCPNSANLHSLDTNSPNYSAKSANLQNWQSNSPNYENWTWDKI
jgi:hypothetical protein